MCGEFQGTLPKPTAKNSIVVGGRVITLIKKDYDGKASPIYSAYDYKTRKLLIWGYTRELLVEILFMLEDKIMVEFNSRKDTLF